MRRLHSLISGLSPSGALAREMFPDTVGADWGNAEELLASVSELIDLGNRQFVLANSAKGTKAPKPIKITRPWEVKKTKRIATPEEVAQLMGGEGRSAPVIAGKDNGSGDLQ